MTSWCVFSRWTFLTHAFWWQIGQETRGSTKSNLELSKLKKVRLEIFHVLGRSDLFSNLMNDHPSYISLPRLSGHQFSTNIKNQKIEIELEDEKRIFEIILVQGKILILAIGLKECHRCR